ncbi:menaquinone biosynthesis decarboxylase [uncultured Campylobacter sp.]|uniref:menaquinone biosynthesis decarboxylase n=1 Tax=uncultured Campylobacter sp. TaxID=218934 RepID=UPI00260CE580|nr:menaquinone biosynthesis decarboxylase [uncultured Campylobacter sp.]
MREWIDKFKEAGLLKVVDEPVDINLQLGHIAYIEVKKDDSKALLFTKPVDRSGRVYPPVFANTFGSMKAVELVFEKTPDLIAKEIEEILKPKKPKNIIEKIDFFTKLLSFRHLFVKKLKGEGECQEIKKFGSEVDLYELPTLTTWQDDGGPFITMGQVYTKSLNGNAQNLGMYRLQVYDKNRLGMHWQIHKDGANFFNEYKEAGLKMPVSVAIGGDPLYIWCGQAPLPKGIFELLLYGFIRKRAARVVKSLTNGIFIPYDCDYVIEGYVDPNELENEGPFGDHTGYYTPILPFPVMRVEAITHKKDPIFHATVVGKPPLEDKYMGYATERIFLPLLKNVTPDLIDYNMPENGVFHNLILAKMNAIYPGHAKQLMHAFWGVGQMSFVKHAIFVPKEAPALTDYEELGRYVLDRISPKNLLISEGMCDQLDHASPNSCYGGKLGVDATFDSTKDGVLLLDDKELLAKFKKIDDNILNLKHYFTKSKNPIILINYDKKRAVKELFNELLALRQHFRILIFIDPNNDINNVYMSVWRIVNSIDAKRDIYIDELQICIDATSKSSWEGYDREWPKEVNCTKSVIEELIKKGLIEDDKEFFKKYEIMG